MGRYIANGILTTVSIRRRNDPLCANKDLLEMKDEILSSLSEMLDLNMYDIEANSKYIILELKKEIFNDNIHDLLKKLDKITHCNALLNNVYDDDERKINLNDDFSKEKQVIELRTMEKDDCFVEEGETYLYCNNEIHELDYAFLPYYQYSLSRKPKVNYYIDMQPGFVLLYYEYDKYDCEDDYTIPYLLNHFSRDYIKDNPLYKSLLFYISG